MSQPEPVLDERGRIDAATSVEAIIAKGWMRFPHDPPHPDSFALADAAITAYQSATGDALKRSSGASPNIEHELMACAHALAEALGEVDVTRSALTEALRERDEARRRDIEQVQDLLDLEARITEAEHRAELAERRNLLNPQSTEYVEMLERRAARAEKVVEAARECVTECDYGDETKTVIPRRWCLTHQDWSPCAHARLAAALAALDTTAGPGGAG